MTGRRGKRVLRRGVLTQRGDIRNNPYVFIWREYQEDVTFLADWSLRWAVLIGLVAVWLALRPPRRTEIRSLLCSSVLAAGPISGGADKTLKLWKSESLVSLLATIADHRGPANFALFSPDGRQIVTGGDDRLVNVWDVQTGTLVRFLAGHASGVRSAAFSPDGTLLATGDTHGCRPEPGLRSGWPPSGFHRPGRDGEGVELERCRRGFHRQVAHRTTGKGQPDRSAQRRNGTARRGVVNRISGSERHGR